MRRVAAAAAVLLIGGLAAAGARAGEHGEPAGPDGARTGALAQPAVCGAARDRRAAYGWPVRPFDRQHPIRGSFGDPRTVERSADPVDGPGSRGSFQFHNGIDIVASDGTPVYPVLDGVARVRHRHEVSVRSRGGRVFQYWHIDPVVRSGQRVRQGATVLGVVQRGAHHVHLGEIDSMRVVNPLAAGHLGPYDDRQAPVVRALLARTPHGAPVPLRALRGEVALIADTFDEQPLPFWGPWFGKPVAPAVVRWRLLDAHGHPLLRWRQVFDVRLHEPPPIRFWQVYAPGTFQNFPVLDDHYDWGRPGRYLYRLTRDLLDTRRLPNGGYTVQVAVRDVCGNHAELRQPVTLANTSFEVGFATTPLYRDGPAHEVLR